MHASVCRPTSSASTSVRPLSRSTTWKSRGPSPGVTPVQSEVYGFMRSPADERDQGLGERCAEAAVPLRLDHADAAGLGHGEVGAADGDARLEELAAQVATGRLGQLARRLELEQVALEVAEDALLERAAGLPQLLPVRPLRHDLLTALTDRPRGDAEVPPQLRVAQAGPGGGREVDAHVPARISARCAVRTPERDRERAPPMCRRHELSAAAQTSAPVSSTP